MRIDDVEEESIDQSTDHLKDPPSGASSKRQQLLVSLPALDSGGESTCTPTPSAAAASWAGGAACGGNATPTATATESDSAFQADSLTRPSYPFQRQSGRPQESEAGTGTTGTTGAARGQEAIGAAGSSLRRNQQQPSSSHHRAEGEEGGVDAADTPSLLKDVLLLPAGLLPGGGGQQLGGDQQLGGGGCVAASPMPTTRSSRSERPMKGDGSFPVTRPSDAEAPAGCCSRGGFVGLLWRMLRGS
eukprot:GHVU01061393.1.p2 GENE.GHVU01061393.1~~GHVU01061393.1.p2  ORF type:complete len:272 (+),score=58.33 GHVU01061393.1:84-818(+)